MNTLTIDTTRRNYSPVQIVNQQAREQNPAADQRSDTEATDVLSMLYRTLFLLALGAAAIVTVSGQFPWFLIPAGVALTIGLLMPAKRDFSTAWFH